LNFTVANAVILVDVAVVVIVVVAVVVAFVGVLI